jgi:hypothetical protein
MDWQTAFRSVIGSGHIKNGTRCQDCSTIERLPDDGLAILVADGAGSAAFGGEGAEITIEAALAFIRRDQGMDDNFVTRCLEAIRAALQAEAAKRRAPFKDFACTFLAAIIRQGKTLLIHIGDGGIVLRRAEGALELVSEPQKAGEYVNQTYFVTSVDPPPHTHRTLDYVPVCVAVFTDGVEGLALNWQENTTPHAPFFDPLFDELATTSGRHENISKALEHFLASAEFNERTDDDKTLALAVDKRRYRIQGQKAEGNKTKVERASSRPPQEGVAARTKEGNYSEKLEKKQAPSRGESFERKESKKSPPEKASPDANQRGQKHQKSNWDILAYGVFFVAIVLVAIVLGRLFGGLYGNEILADLFVLFVLFVIFVLIVAFVVILYSILSGKKR